jgi:hypothetical protein
MIELFVLGSISIFLGVLGFKWTIKRSKCRDSQSVYKGFFAYENRQLYMTFMTLIFGGFLLMGLIFFK